MKDLHVAISPLSGKIYAGKIAKSGKEWTDNRTDITGMAIGLTCEHVVMNGGSMTVSANGKPAFEITVNKVEG